jgi:2-polyprenyl-6-methoxyphenol hydroxylase-like FAD-dependent oxidoreductase
MRRILVNGGGIAGAAFALGMAREGHAVDVVERQPEARWRNGADILKPSGLAVLADLGLTDALFEAGAIRRETVDFHFDRHLVFRLDYREQDAGFPFFVNMPRERLLRLLLAELAGHEAVTFHNGRNIAQFGRESGRFVSATLDNGVTISLDLLAGADGAASRVRQEMGVEMARTSYDAPLLYGDLPLVDSVAERNRLYCDSEGGMAYYYPVAPGFTRLVISFPPAELRALRANSSGKAMRERLYRLTGESSHDAIDAVSDPGRFYRAPVFRANCPSYAVANAALLGDAAHLIHPITGQGMNLALEDAGALVECLRGTTWAAADVERRLQDYGRARRDLNEGVIAYGDRLARSLGDRQALLRAIDPRFQSSERRHLQPYPDSQTGTIHAIS